MSEHDIDSQDEQRIAVLLHSPPVFRALTIEERRGVAEAIVTLRKYAAEADAAFNSNYGGEIRQIKADVIQFVQTTATLPEDLRQLVLEGLEQREREAARRRRITMFDHEQDMLYGSGTASDVWRYLRKMIDEPKERARWLRGARRQSLLSQLLGAISRFVS